MIFAPIKIQNLKYSLCSDCTGQDTVVDFLLSIEFTSPRTLFFNDFFDRHIVTFIIVKERIAKPIMIPSAEMAANTGISIQEEPCYKECRTSENRIPDVIWQRIGLISFRPKQTLPVFFSQWDLSVFGSPQL